MGRLVKLLGAIITGVIIMALGSYFWYQNAVAIPNGLSTELEVFAVEKGQGVETIAEKLVEQGFVANKLALQIYLKLNPGLANSIQAGSFELSTSMSIVEIVEKLQKATDLDYVKLTIPEGMRYDEIAEKAATVFAGKNEAKFVESEFIAIAEAPDSTTFNSKVTAFLQKYKPAGKNLEGFLYPETYFFKPDTTALAVIEKLISTLEEKVITANVITAAHLEKYSFYEYLTIASIIERETFTLEEKPLIADIYFRRLEQGVQGVKLLQADATLTYIVKDWKADVFPLKTNKSPYNTYLYPGLPPTPISNPGLAAIKASVNPEANDYWYYIHDNDGVVHYAKTLAEHEANIRKYL